MLARWAIFRLFLYVLQIPEVCSITPKFTWPLAADYPGAEVKDGDVDGTVGNDIIRCSPYPLLDYDSIFLTGTPNSFLDLTVTKAARYGKLSFTMFLAAAPPYIGVILHYKRTSIYGTIEEIMLWMNGSHLIVDTLATDDVIYPSLAVANPFATENKSFIPLTLSYDDQGEVLFATPDLDLLFTTLVPWENRKFSVPCRVRVGGALPGANLTNTARLSGRITCLHMYSEYFKNSDFESATTDCLKEKWSNEPIAPITPQTSLCWQGGARYVISKDGAVPQETVAHMEAISASSKLQCAEKCSRADTCLSFAFVRALKRCRCFESIISEDHFDEIPDAKYYTRRSHCC